MKILGFKIKNMEQVLEQVLEQIKNKEVFNKMRVNFRELREERLKQIDIDLRAARKRKDYKTINMLTVERKNIIKQLGD